MFLIQHLEVALEYDNLNNFSLCDMGVDNYPLVYLVDSSLYALNNQDLN